MLEYVLRDHAVVTALEGGRVVERLGIAIVARNASEAAGGQVSDEAASARTVIENSVLATKAGAAQTAQLIVIEDTQTCVFGEGKERVLRVVGGEVRVFAR